MRGALQATRARLPITTNDLSWPSRLRLTALRRRQVTGEELEIIERLARERRTARRSGGHKSDAFLHRQWR